MRKKIADTVVKSRNKRRTLTKYHTLKENQNIKEHSEKLIALSTTFVIGQIRRPEFWLFIKNVLIFVKMMLRDELRDFMKF